MPQRLRIFISSPADVPDERLRADLVVDKLSQDYCRFFTIESYRWEHEAMLASAHFQDAIEPPSAFDIVVLILWSRLGTPLPEKTAAREYRGIDGRVPVTGTEWEYEEALQVAREKKAPDLLAFRNISPAPIDPRDVAAQAESMAQLAALNEFWTRHFADKGVFLTAYDEYRTLEEFALRLEESLRRLIERRIKDASAGEPRAEPVWLSDPFRGLESYEFEHAPIFFGRDAAVAKATEQLAANARAGRAFLLVSGASGSGKSSLVKAGIVPRLMKPQRISGIAHLRRIVFRPGSEDGDIFLALAKALTRDDGGDIGLRELMTPGQDVAQLAEHLRDGTPGYLFANALGRLTESSRKSGHILNFEDAKLILVVDQLEELFTARGIGPEQRRQFLQLLGGLARSGAVWVIATLRADFWHRAADIPEVIALAEGQGRLDLAAPSAAELAEMIRKPAQAAGLSFEIHTGSGLGLDAVLAEHAAAAPGALPLLSFTLDELYRSAKARGTTVLTHASYEALGGLAGAIAKRADEVMASLPAAAQAALPRVLRALTTVADTADQAPLSRSAPLENFVEGSPARVLIDAFVAARLLVAADESGAGASVRLAHEALIGRWQRARDQLANDRRDLQTRTVIERQYERSRQASRHARRLLLLRNPDLANAVDLATRWGDELDSPLRDFIARSSRRARFALTLTAAAAAVFAVVALAAGGLFWVASQQRGNALVAQSKFLAQSAHTATENGNATLGALLALAALPKHLAAPDRPFVRDAEFALEEALAAQRERAILKLEDMKKSFTSGAISPDGTRVVTGVSDKTARIWDAATGKQLLVLNTPGTVRTVDFSPDGRRVITTDGFINPRDWYVWDAATGRQLFVINKPEDASFSSDGRLMLVRMGTSGPIQVRDAETGKIIASPTGLTPRLFSPDGKTILAFGEGKVVKVWNPTTGALQELSSAQNYPSSFHSAFSPDGTRVITASPLWSTAQLFDVATGNQITSLATPNHCCIDWLRPAISADNSRVLTASDKSAYLFDARSGALIKSWDHDKDIATAVFSPDGKRAITTSPGRVHLIDTATGNEITALRARTEDEVPLVLFSPDGTRLLVAFDAVSLELIDSATGAQVARLNGVIRSRQRAMFTPDGRSVATASSDGAVHLWDLQSGRSLAVLRDSAGESLALILFSADGRRVLTRSADAVRIWDTSMFRGHTGAVYAAVFSPDGSRLATASADKTARIWNVATQRQLTVLRGHQGEVYAVAFAPDGKSLVTASADKTARIWDAATGKELLVLKGHDAAVRSAAFSPDGKRVVTASDDKTARVWDAATGASMVVFRGHQGAVTSAVFSPDGRQVLSAGFPYAMIWDSHSGAMVRTLKQLIDVPDAQATWDGLSPNLASAWNHLMRAREYTARAQGSMHGAGQMFASFSPDGKQVVGGFSWLVEVWDAATDLPHRTIFAEATRSAGFSPDGRYVVTASSATTQLWQVKRSDPRSYLAAELHAGDAYSAAFSPRGDRVVTASADATAQIWPTVHCQAAIDRARAQLPRRLSDAERSQYFLDQQTATTGTASFTTVNRWLSFVLPTAGDTCE